MRKTLIAGLLLIAAALLTLWLGGLLDLEIDSVLLLGIAAGAVVGLVPDASAGRRLAGFALGVFVTLVGYLLRASVLPDTDGGRAVFIVLVLAASVGVVVLSTGKLRLWSVLLGLGVFVGAFEEAYVAAPPRVVDNSITSLTGLALCVAVGFLATALLPQDEKTALPGHRDGDRELNDELMENTK
jgi:hypothetical protein